MANTIIAEELENYISYLVQDLGYKKISELPRQERGELFYLVLVNNKMYVDMVRLAARSFKNEVDKTERMTA